MIELTSEEQSALENWSRSGKTEQRLAFRSKIILAASDGKENKYIAGDIDTTVSTVGKWRHRFVESRINGLYDDSRSVLYRNTMIQHWRNAFWKHLISLYLMDMLPGLALY